MASETQAVLLTALYNCIFGLKLATSNLSPMARVQAVNILDKLAAAVG